MSTTSRRREESKVNLERKSNFKAIGRNALAKVRCFLWFLLSIELTACIYY